MAKHKAPTQITVASIQEKTFLHEFVDRYWKLGALLAVGSSLAILIPVYQGRQANQAHHTTWDDLRAQADLGSGLFSQIQGGSAEALAQFADQHRESPVGAWAKAMQVGAAIQADQLPEAQKASEELARLWPDHLLSQAKIYPGVGGEGLTLEDVVRTGKHRLEAWEKEHATLFANPPLPQDAPRVRIRTSKGPLLVGLYSDRAPQHAESFLAHCRAGDYTGTKFHRVVRGSLVQGGDPNSIAGEPDSWGLGGAGESLELEIDPRLRHFRGALAAWKAPGDTRSNGSQFYITTQNQNQLDGQSVVFGMLLEGNETLEAIESGAVVGDRPQDPAVIESIEVL